MAMKHVFLSFLFLIQSTQQRTIKFMIEPSRKEISSYVQQLVEGNLQRIQQGSKLTSSVSLVYDEGYYLVVDSPSATDIKAKENMLRGLASRNLVPGEVQLVVTTHGHPDHFGQGNFFPNARHFFGSYEYSDDNFIKTELHTKESMQLTPNVYLWNTPGHTAQDVSVIVHNVPCCGIVAVSGDLFYNEEDAINGTEWFSDAWNPIIGKMSRNKVICGANYIIPGHGKLFKVTDEMKIAAECNGPVETTEVAAATSSSTTQSTTISIPITETPAPILPVFTFTTLPTNLITSPVTVDHIEDEDTPPPEELNGNLVKRMNDAFPNVISAINTTQIKDNSILAPVVESAATQLASLLSVPPQSTGQPYPFTTFFKNTFRRIAGDPDIKHLISDPNISTQMNRLRPFTSYLETIRNYVPQRSHDENN